MTDTINIPRAELQAALDAIDEYYATTPEGKALIETLRAALAQGEQEPVAWDVFVKHSYIYFSIGNQSFQLAMAPEDEPDMSAGQIAAWYMTQLRNALARLASTAPPQRPWQGLTEQDTLQIRAEWEVRDYRLSELCRAIEAKLREKNA